MDTSGAPTPSARTRAAAASAVTWSAVGLLAVLATAAALLVGCGQQTTTVRDHDVAGQGSTPTVGTTGAAQQETRPRTDALARLQAWAAAPLDARAARAVPWAPLVTYRVGGTIVRQVEPVRARLPRTWSGCPGTMLLYEGRDCPVSPLATIRTFQALGGPVVEHAWGAGCLVARLPEGTTALRTVAEQRDCFHDGAVLVSTDPLGRITALDVRFTGP